MATKSGLSPRVSVDPTFSATGGVSGCAAGALVAAAPSPVVAPAPAVGAAPAWAGAVLAGGALPPGWPDAAGDTGAQAISVSATPSQSHRDRCIRCSSAPRRGHGGAPRRSHLAYPSGASGAGRPPRPL